MSIRKPRCWLVVLWAAAAGAGIVALLDDDTSPPPKLCHSVTEDSVILDCDYRNGTWYPYPE